MKNTELGVLVLLIAFLVLFLSGCSHQNEPPTADFTRDPDSGEAPLDVSFDASGSSDPDGEIISYDWEVDGDSDSIEEEGSTVSHTFENSGEWEVELTVTDDEGATDSTTKSVHVTTESNEEPEARISTNPEPTDGTVTVEVDEEIEFDGGDSSDPDGEIESYEWDFGDEVSTERGEVVTQAFEEPGDYTVKLTVTDNDLGRDSTTEEIEVEPEDLTASFTWEPDSPYAGDEVAFDASDSTGSIESYEWDFGEGEGTGTGETTVHTYDEVDTFQVKLTVTDKYGFEDSKTREITISPTPPIPGKTAR